MSLQLHLLRHGEVEPSAHRLFGGCRLDHGLSDVGERQAERLARHLQRYQFDAIYCSPMKRARLTLEPTLEGRGLQPIIDERLKELDFGLWTGLKWEEVQEKFSTSAFDWLHQLDGPGFPEGETGLHAAARVRGVFDDIFKHHTSGQHIAIMCHGGMVRIALAVLMDFKIPQTAHLEVDYASHTWVSAGGHSDWRPRNKIELMNFTPWRDLAE